MFDKCSLTTYLGTDVTYDFGNEFIWYVFPNERWRNEGRCDENKVNKKRVRNRFSRFAHSRFARPSLWGHGLVRRSGMWVQFYFPFVQFAHRLTHLVLQDRGNLDVFSKRSFTVKECNFYSVLWNWRQPQWNLKWSAKRNSSIYLPQCLSLWTVKTINSMLVIWKFVIWHFLKSLFSPFHNRL